MPSNGKFGFSILVGDKELPEYNHPADSSRVLVESILWAPVTYWLEIKEFCKFSGEIEAQKWPVTPYEIKVYADPSLPVTSHFKVFVDGVDVGSMWLKRGESKIIPGFPNKDGSHKEFLFSLPRFADDHNDRVESTRSHRIGKIEVIRYETSFSHKEMRPVGSRSRQVDFTQANKKDVKDVTNNEYCMTTTRQGKLIRKEKPYSRPTAKHEKESVNIWTIGDELDKLRVEYHMTQTLIDWGIQPVRAGWAGSGSTGLPSVSSHKSE